MSIDSSSPTPATPMSNCLRIATKAGYVALAKRLRRIVTMETQPSVTTSGRYSRTAVTPACLTERGQENLVDELEKLANLHDRGAITDSVFDAAKKKLLRVKLDCKAEHLRRRCRR